MAIEAERWGVLYCPRRRSRGAAKHRERLSRLLDERHVAYDLVQSESPDSVERLVRMFITNGYKTIVIVGGDSSLNDAVNCLMEMEPSEREEISLGVIPNGIMNDFSKFWDLKDSDPEKSVETIINHRTRKVDVGKLNYKDRKGRLLGRYFLNCVNVGLIADIMNLRNQTRSMLGSRVLSFIVSALVIIFHRMEYKMRLSLNSTTIERRIMNVCIGNSTGYGQTPSAVPYNGMLDVSIVCHPGIFQLFEGFYLLITGRFLNHRSVIPFRTRKITFSLVSHAKVGVDGRLLGNADGEMDLGVEPEAINFIIPA